MAEDKDRLTKEILLEAVAKKEGVEVDQVKDLTFELSAGSNKGDNFTCTVYQTNVKATVGGQEKTYDFIAKVVPVSEFQQFFVMGSKLFHNEVYYYNDMVPKLEQYVKKHPQLELTSPECYYANVEKMVIVMDNLKRFGYTMVDRKVGLTMNQLIPSLQRLADYHALTYHYIQDVGFDTLKGTIIHRNTWMPADDKDGNFENMLRMMFSHMQKHAENNNWDMAEDFKTVNEQEDLISRFNRLYSLDNSKFNVIIHGDCWSNNLLFRYNDEGKVVEMKYVDFQVGRMNIPVLDVAHIFGASTDPEERAGEWKNWLQVYHDQLMSSLSIMGYDGSTLYPFETFLKDFHLARLFMFFIGVFMAQGTLTDEAKDGGAMDMDNFKDMKSMDEMEEKGGEIFKNMPGHEAVKKRFTLLMKEAKEHDVFSF